MGKKRKAPSGQKAPQKSPENSSKLALSGWQDVADSEDEFLLNRERILLEEGPEAKRRRKIQEEGPFSSQCFMLRANQLPQSASLNRMASKSSTYLILTKTKSMITPMMTMAKIIPAMTTTKSMAPRQKSTSTRTKIRMVIPRTTFRDGEPRGRISTVQTPSIRSKLPSKKKLRREGFKRSSYNP
jgi:hypothetical protein